MRVIAGSAKRLQLKTIEGMDTRPTTDRIKETLFNMLQSDIPGCKFLDLYSGSGAIGIEALSRGAAHAVAVDFKTGKLILENAKHCHVEDRLEIIPRKLSQLKNYMMGQQFDYIFSDPPYENGFIQDTIDLVVTYDLLKPDGVLLLEHHKDEAFTLPESWECIKEQKFGYTMVSYFVNIAERS